MVMCVLGFKDVSIGRLGFPMVRLRGYRATLCCFDAGAGCFLAFWEGMESWKGRGNGNPHFGACSCFSSIVLWFGSGGGTSAAKVAFTSVTQYIDSFGMMTVLWWYVRRLKLLLSRYLHFACRLSAREGVAMRLLISYPT